MFEIVLKFYNIEARYHHLDVMSGDQLYFQKGVNIFVKVICTELIGLNTINVVLRHVLERIIYVLNSLLTNLPLYLRYFHNLISDKHFSLCMLIILAKQISAYQLFPC